MNERILLVIGAMFCIGASLFGYWLHKKGMANKGNPDWFVARIGTIILWVFLVLGLLFALWAYGMPVSDLHETKNQGSQTSVYTSSVSFQSNPCYDPLNTQYETEKCKSRRVSQNSQLFIRVVGIVLFLLALFLLPSKPTSGNKSS